jgi:predicted metalloprotease with PDZ domain
MNSARKMFLLIGFLAAFSASALAIRCPCVTLGKDTCGGCFGSSCEELCAIRVGPNKVAGWDQMIPGFSTKQVSGKLVVSEILPASPAEHAGVRVGDEVLALDGMRMPLCRNEAAIWQRPASNHAVVVRRGRSTLTLEVGVVPLSALLQRSVPAAVRNVSVRTGSASLPQWSPFLSGLVLSSSGQGARVVSVLPGSSASENGIKPGDIVLSSDGQAVTDLHPLEGADYKATLQLQVAGPSGERAVHLGMRSVADTLQALAHNRTAQPTVSAGF